jgi:hypothetical protein
MYRQSPQSVGLSVKNGEGGIRTLRIGVTTRILALLSLRLDKAYLFISTLVFPQALLIYAALLRAFFCL